MRFARLFRNLFRTQHAERALDAEVQAYLDLLVDEKIAKGMTPDEARRAARIELGGVEQVKEQMREVRAGVAIEQLLQDVTYALRTLRRSPAFAVAAVLTLALCIGANAAVFAVIDAVLLRPLPFHDPDRLVRIWESNPSQGIDRGEVSPGSFVEWRTRSRAFDGLGLYFPARDWLLAFGDEADSVRGTLATPSVFEILGVRPLLGRAFRPESQQTPPFGDQREIILGYGLWQRRFGGRIDILGQVVMLEGRVPLTIIGVMPPGFDFPDKSEAWRSETFLRPVGPVQRLFRYYESIGRLRAGFTLEQARNELSDISARLTTEYPQSNAGFGVRVERLDRATVGHVRLGLTLLLGIVVSLLLIGCANVANLMLARAWARRQEIAMRVALGAAPRRLLQQVLTEAAVLAALGASAGLLTGFWATRLLVALAPGGIPRLDEVSVGGPVLLFTAGIAILTMLATGLLPAMQGRRSGLQHAAPAADRHTAASTRAVRWIIVGQTALTLILLVGAMLLLRSFVRLRQVELGFDSAHVLTTDLRFPTSRFRESARPWFRLGQQYDQILAEIAALPDVESVSGITVMPLTGQASAGRFWLDDGSAGRPDATKQFTADIHVVTPGFFSTMRIPAVRGRLFDATDRLSNEALTNPAEDSRQRPTGVVIVNQALARRFWPSEEPIGRAIRLFDHWAVSSSTIVGVVADVRSRGVADEAEPAIYVPWGEMAGFRLSLAVRTQATASALAPALRARIRELDPQVLVSTIRPMDDVVASAVSRPFFNLALVGTFGVLAVALAAVGIYGVVAYLVAQCTREIGIRTALGASPVNVVRHILGEGLHPVLVGAAAGLAGSLALVRVVRGFLFGITPLDPLSFFAAAIALLVVAAIAAFMPARRATRIDPLVVLRHE